MNPSRTPRSQERSGDDRSDSTSLTLIEGIRIDDEEAWKRAVRIYTPFLRYWCRHWGVPDEEVEDVVQEVFQATFLCLKDFRRDRDGDSFRGWLRGIARHKVLGWFRRRGARGPGGTDFYRRSLLVPDPGGQPILDLEETDRGHGVDAIYREALNLVRAEFEERTWQAFWRAAVEGQAPAIIAEDLGVTPAAVRQAKSRVLRRFKDLLGEPLRTPLTSRSA
jgi:RNA polymerase sigma-70 factor (ECF subfamily)